MLIADSAARRGELLLARLRVRLILILAAVQWLPGWDPLRRQVGLATCGVALLVSWVMLRLVRRRFRPWMSVATAAIDVTFVTASLVAYVIVFPMVFPMSPGAMSWVMLYQIVTNTLLHSGYELMPARRDGRPMLDFIVTTTHHDLHHAQAGWNYAAWFTWWDRWFGTEHPEYHTRFAARAWRPFGARPEAQPLPAE